MGVDTKAIIRKEISARDIFDIVVEKLDGDADYGVDNGSGFISFEYKGDMRGIFYCETNDYSELFNGEDHICLVLGHTDYTAELMTEIVKEFGGWVIENDCSDDEPVYIEEGEKISYTGFTIKRNRLVDALDENISEKERIKIATQILNNKEVIKRLI